MAAAEPINFRGSGVDLFGDAAGPPDAAPILFLHGSGQTRQSWTKAMGAVVARGYRGITLDLRGHGDSGWSPDGGYTLDLFAQDLLRVLDALPAPPIVVGASLGGLAGMLAAAQAPERLRALVLVDITVSVERGGAREVIDFMGSGLEGFASLEEAADAVAAYLPHRPRPANTSGLSRNLRLRDGRYYWHWDPAFMRMGQDSETPSNSPHRLREAARALTIPTLLLRGGRSRITTDEGVREFLELAPHTEYIDIDGAHHMVAGDANDAFNDALLDFIDRLEAAAYR
jgi:pimeloyl-ACP methyl ester carboxylesterase